LDSLDPVFGAMVGAHHVDEAIRLVLAQWDRTYLQEVARRSGEDPDQLRPFRTWRISSELEKMPEDQTPTCIIANKGLIEPPEKRNFTRPGMSYKATWRYQLGVHVSARGRKHNAAPRAVTLAKMYCLAIRTVIVQKRDEYEDPDIETVLGFIDWIDENYDDLDSDNERTICMAHCDFDVTVQEVTTWGTGPKAPVAEPDPPLPDVPMWPVVTHIIPEYVKVRINEEV
jgi:hypothetical protein